VNRIERQRRAQGAAARKSGTRALSTLTAGLAVAGSFGVGAVAWSAHQTALAKYAAAQQAATASTSTTSTTQTSNVVKLPPVSSIGSQTTVLQQPQQAPAVSNNGGGGQAVSSGS